MNPIQKKILPILSVLLGLVLLFPAPVLAETEEGLVPHSYFDDTLFVGDSISLQLRNYVKKRRSRGEDLLGKAQFFTRGGFGSGIALQPVTGDSLHPYLNDEKMTVEDAVAVSGANKVYIMLGMNDIVPYGPEGAVQNLETLTDRILEKSPDVILAFQSVTPIMTDKQQRNLNNTSIPLYNQALESFCSRRGYEFLDVASVFRDGDGGLIAAYCGDAPGMGMHISNEGCPPWIDYLLANPITDVPEPDEEDVEIVAEEETAEDLNEAEAEEDTGRVFQDYEDPDELEIEAEVVEESEEELLSPDESLDSVAAPQPETPPTQERSKMKISGTSSVTSSKPTWQRKKEALLTPRT